MPMEYENINLNIKYNWYNFVEIYFEYENPDSDFLTGACYNYAG